MFAAFLKPVRREFLFTFIAVSIALAFGSWWAFDGGLWTWGGLIFSGLLFVDAGHNWPKLHASTFLLDAGSAAHLRPQLCGRL